MRTSRRKPAKRVADPSKRIQDFTSLQEWYDNISDEDHARFCAALMKAFPPPLPEPDCRPLSDEPLPSELPRRPRLRVVK